MPEACKATMPQASTPVQPIRARQGSRQLVPTQLQRLQLRRQLPLPAPPEWPLPQPARQLVAAQVEALKLRREGLRRRQSSLDRIVSQN